MAAMAATIRKFQSLRIQMTNTLSLSSTSRKCFSSWSPLPTAKTSPLAATPLFFQRGSTSGTTVRICNFSSFRPPPPPRPPTAPSSSNSGGGEVPSRLQRPPSISLHRIPPKLRNHAVSLFHGDYRDHEEEHVDWKGMGPLRYVGEENAGDDDDAYDTKAAGAGADDFVYDEDEDGENADWTNDDDELSLNDRWLIRNAKRQEQEEAAKRKKWLIHAQPKTFVAKIDARGRSYGRGGRKTAHARVWIQPGLGNIVVNRKDFVEYFTRDSDRENIVMPFVVTGTAGKFDVQAYVFGSGTSGQAGAVRHGVARALQNYNPDLYRAVLKKFGYLTRDPRQVERKKIAHKKARKKRQWNRR